MLARGSLFCLWFFSAAVLLLIGLLPHTGLYRTMTVLSGSMEPTFSPGDIVIVTKKPASQIELGNVITYAIPVGDHHIESHRIVKIERRSPSLVVQTKGDANNAVDPWLAELRDAEIWTVSGTVPYAGWPIMWFRSPLVHKLALFVTPAVIALLGLRAIWRRREDDGTLPDLNTHASRR
jgi:signal peptidase